MALIDGFLGSVGSVLHNRTASNSSTYTRTRRDGGTVELAISPSGYLRHQGAIASFGTVLYSNSTTPPSADYEVAGVFTWKGEPVGSTTSSNYRLGFGLRFDSASNNGYAATIRYHSAGGTRVFSFINMNGSSYPGAGGNSSNILLTVGHTYCVIIKAEGTTISAGILNMTTNRWLNNSTGLFDIESATPFYCITLTGATIVDARLSGFLASQPPEITPSDTTGYGVKQWHLAASNVLSEIPKIVISSAPTEGFDAIASTNFSIGYTGTIPASKNVTVTPSDGGLGGTFSPTSAVLDNSTTTATFTYTPANLAEGAADVNATLTFAAEGAISAFAPYRIFTPKLVFTTSTALSWVNEASNTFTVGLNGVISSIGSEIVVNLSDGSGGTFTPSSVTLTPVNTTRTFTYTASSTGSKTLTLTATGVDTKTHSVTVGNKPTTLTLVAPNPASGKLGSYSGDFELTVNGLLINDIPVTLTDANKNTEFPAITFRNLTQSPTPLQTYKFRIRPRNLEVLTITASASGLTSSNTGFSVLPASRSYTKSLVFSDNFNRADNTELGNGWLDNAQYAIVGNQIVTTNDKQTAPIALYTGNTFRSYARATLDKDSFTITTTEPDGFYRTAVGESVQSILNEIPTSTISSKPNNQTLVLSNKPTVSNPKDLLRGASVKDAQVSASFTPPQGFNWRPVDRKSVRLVLRRQSNSANYFVEIFGELQADNSLKVYGNLYKKVSFRELPDKIHESFVILPNVAHTFSFASYSVGNGTILELSAVNSSTSLETVFFKLVDGEPELQLPGDVGLSHTGVVNIDDFSYHSLSVIKRKPARFYYVDGTNGSNSNVGTSTAPFQTLQYALTKTLDNNNYLIFIRPGTYNLNNNETTPLIIPDGVSLIGETDAPTIQGSILIDGTRDSSLINLKFDGNNYSSKIGVVIKNAINFLFQGVEISKYTETGLVLQRIASAQFDSCKITDCSYSNLVTTIPVGSTDLQTSAMRIGFLYSSKISNFNIDTLSFRGGQAVESWSESWERY